MSNELRFDGKVVIVTGAGNGLGRSHALAFAKRGAKVVVNDLGGGFTGGGKSSAAADKVVEEIKAAGGQAVANYDSVEDGDKIVRTAMDAFGAVDVLVNNAGILRDTSFQKMTQEDWDLIYKVHVLGAFRCTHAVWNHMRDKGYGRIIFTASAAGIYGNFGQANYSMAKLGLHGFAQTLAIEGKKKNVIVNSIAPIAGSRMTETVLPKELVDALKPEYVTPLVLWLCHESNQDTGGLYEVGGGFMGKLRWERAQGKMFKLGRDITPEQVKNAWNDISGFEKTTHPADVASSMQPILGNLQSKSKGGNEFIDVDEALGYEFPPLTSSYDERDLAIYALGVGAARNPLDDKELKTVYEMHGDGFVALPTFAVTPPLKVMMEEAKKGAKAPGLNYGFDRVLHGEQYLEVKRPLPPRAKLTHKAKIKDIFDKGKHALVVQAVTTYDETGQELFYNEFTTFVRGAGGWGGERGPSAEVNVPPDREPDAEVTEKIPENQALLYRLSGDWNPLHADPSFARAFGFDRPILHGLCTFGYAARHVISKFAPNGDPRFFKSIKVRFAEPVFPGETVRTEMWKEGDKIVFRTSVVERDVGRTPERSEGSAAAPTTTGSARERVVISNAAVELYKEIPKAAAPKATAPAAAAGAASSGPTSKDVFAVIKAYLADNPDMVKSVGTTFQFLLKNPDSAYLIDIKDKGTVIEGKADKADVTLEISDSDFMDLTSGKADAQKLYFGGKLKISGNVMASQKLQFLAKIDKQKYAHVVTGGGAAAPAAGGAGAAAPDPGSFTSADVFVAIDDHIKRTSGIVQKIGTTFQFKLKNPDAEYFVDVKNGTGGVTKGAGEKPDVTLEISDGDFMDMTSGKADPQKLYFGGKLKISGNVMASQKLMFLKDVKPDQALEAIKKARAAAGGGAQAAAPAQKKETLLPQIFKAIEDRIAKNGGLVKEVGAVVHVNVKDSGTAWTLDLKSGSGSAKNGAEGKADTTLTFDEEALVELAKGTESLQSLYQRGRMRVDGDVRPATRLGFLKQLI
jgi:3-hydroxyacyl-CoA dehydrogenase/3a,7a,12a-trihydroxy-5b-cholest-24-enoyl-CoA hydratase